MKYKRKIKKERGFILITGLILLLILTLGVLYSMGNSILQEKSSGSIEDRTIAFHNAESALRYAENYVFTKNLIVNDFNTDCNGGLCITSTTSTPVWNKYNWTTDKTHIIQLPANAIGNTLIQPKFIIELLGGVPSPVGESIKVTSSNSGGTAYRITAFGFGNRNGTSVQLQSVFVKR